MVQLDESGKRELFCVFMALGFSPEQSAARAGYGLREQKSVPARLLGEARLRKRLAKLTKELDSRSAAALARAGLARLALGTPENAAALLGEGDRMPKEEDLFFVSELRRPKGGGIELKFFDRLRALSLLAELDGGQRERAGGLLDALARSAAEIAEGDRNGDAV